MTQTSKPSGHAQLPLDPHAGGRMTLMRRQRGWARRGSVGAAFLAVMAAAPTAYAVATAPAAAAAPAPITIAYITSVTGPGASEDATSPGAFKARIDLQNAEG